MYIDRLECEGLAGLDPAEIELDRVEHLEGPRPRLSALADALLIPFATVDAAAFSALLEGWGLRPEIDTDGGHSAHWCEAPWMRSLLDPESEGRVRVSLRMVLDPPLFGRLRELAARDARLVDALGAGATVTLVTGLRFSPDFDAVAAELLGVRVGEEAFPVSGPDRPSWLDGFLRRLRGRAFRGLGPVEAWARAAGSWSVDDQNAYRRAALGVVKPPFSLGRVLPVPGGPALWRDGRVVPAFRHGEGAVRALREAAAAWLVGADIWILPTPHPDRAAWYPRLVEGDDSPLEQVILLEGDDPR